MINPSKITDYNRTIPELEEFLLFCVCAAGKDSHVQAHKLNIFLKSCSWVSERPFVRISQMILTDSLMDNLKRAKLGKYKLLHDSFSELVARGFDLKNVDWWKLTTIPGIGIKTAKFFVCHSQEDFHGAILDTHVLKWLQMQFPRFKVPKTSPSNAKQYQLWENFFLAACYQRKTTVAKLDLEIWNSQGKLA